MFHRLSATAATPRWTGTASNVSAGWNRRFGSRVFNSNSQRHAVTYWRASGSIRDDFTRFRTSTQAEFSFARR